MCSNRGYFARPRWSRSGILPRPVVVRGRPRPMQRWATAIFGIFFLAAVVVVVLNTAPPQPLEAPPPLPVSASARPARSGAPTPDASSKPDGGPAPSEPDGGVPPLPDGAPRDVEIGVIQLVYRGAERAPQDARPREAALEQAKELISAAQQDFDATVSRGDAGSAKDLGRIPRGVLEPHVEYEVFTLQPGEVTSEPLDTPRGYWIVRRNQ
jgi:hypothetical protein